MSIARYQAVSLSPDGTAIADQMVVPLATRPALACLVDLAALNAHGRAFATEWLGAVILARLTIHFDDVCARYNVKPPEAQREALGRILTPSGLSVTPIPPVHLRLAVHARPDRLQVMRERPTGTIPAAALLLAALSLSGPHAAARQVGSTVLTELVELHPDVFARYPQLTTQAPEHG